MVHRALMIQGLRKQQTILNGLIREIESNREGDESLFELIETRTSQISRNLKHLRSIRAGYFNSLGASSES